MKQYYLHTESYSAADRRASEMGLTQTQYNIVQRKDGTADLYYTK